MRDGKHVILCIDDDPEFLESTASLLEGAGYLLETATSAAEGLERYRGSSPDMVLVDLMMEEIDAGLTLVGQITELGDPPPIYVLSGVGKEVQRHVDQASLGVNGVLQKPISPDSLLGLLDANLRS
jgi:CheY-like chemotaxis protein